MGLSKKAKIIITSAVCVTVVVAVILCAVILSSNKRTVMKYGSYRVTEDMYEFWMSEYKRDILKSFKGAKDTDEFWDSISASGKTHEQYFTDMIDYYIMQKLVASAVFDSQGYTLSNEARQEIANTLSDICEYVADGDEDKFNEIAGQYGIDYDGYKNLLIYDYRLTYLWSIMYGSGTTGLSTTELDEFYNETYDRVKIVVIYTERDFKRDTDASPLLDKNGQYQWEKYTPDEKAEKLALVETMKGEIASGSMSEEKFTSYWENENRDVTSGKYQDGYYMSKYSVYDSQVIKKSAELSVGEIGVVELDDENGSVMFIKRYENKPHAYADALYSESEWFESFYYRATEHFFAKMLDSYTSGIEIDYEVKSQIKLRDVKTNKDF
ncbi:MAG: hypothetical protein IKA74_02685 [Clostridia bacterium]|nr:hypothetical protein [Clostridia bacterium]